MVGHEKRINEVKSRFTDSEFLVLSKLAAISDRTIGDYVHHVVTSHLFGHASRLGVTDPVNNQTDRGD